jgi:hypothetical protein
VVLLAVVVLVGAGYALYRARSGAGETPSGTPGTTQPKAPEAPAPSPSSPSSPRTLYVATPWARLYSEPRPDAGVWDIAALGMRIDFDPASLSNGFISVKQFKPEGWMQGMDGYLRESELRAQPFTFDEAWNEAEKALTSLKVETASRYLQLAFQLDPSRRELLEIRKVLAEERRTSVPDAEETLAKLGPGQGPEDAEKLAVGDIWYAIPLRYPEGLEGLRNAPDPATPVLRQVEKDEPLRVLEIQDKWVRVARVDDSTLRDLSAAVLPVDAGEPEVPPEDAGTPEPAELPVFTGYLRAQALQPWPEDRERLERHLKLHTQAGDARQEVRLRVGKAKGAPERSAERAREEQALFTAAWKARQYTIAARAAVRLRKLDDTAVELTYVFGCRGDRSQAQLLKVSEIDQAQPGQGPKDACLLYDRNPEHCVYCASEEDYEGSPPPRSDKAKEAKRQREEEQLWERLQKAFPDGPLLRVRYAETPASARNGLQLHVVGRSYEMHWVCQNGAYSVSRDRMKSGADAVQVKWPQSGEALLWLTPSFQGNAVLTVRFLEHPEQDNLHSDLGGYGSPIESLQDLYEDKHREVSHLFQTADELIPYTFAPQLENCPGPPDEATSQ